MAAVHFTTIPHKPNTAGRHRESHILLRYSSLYSNNVVHRWRLYILPQYLTNLTQPVGIEKAIYSCDIHPCTVTTLCIDGGCMYRWRLYILPQYLTNLIQPVGIEKAIYSCDIHPCTVTTLCIDGGCTFYHNTSNKQPVHRESRLAHPCTVTTLCIDGGCTFYHNTSQT